MKLKVEGHPGLIRDTNSKAIITDDPRNYSAYLNEKSYRNNLQNQTENLQSEMNNLKSEMAEIKQLLYKLVNINN